jgi:hypothetical protein
MVSSFLVCSRTSDPDKQRGQGLDKDPEVKPQAPVLHIPHVIVDPAAYALGIGRLPTGEPLT